jgi:hypothetical protein
MRKLALAIGAVAMALASAPHGAAQDTAVPAGPACASKVMAFYYAWYGGPPDYRHWASATDDPRFSHDPNQVVATGDQYPAGVRRDIASTDYPTLGPYDSRDAGTIDRHLRWARRAGIDDLIVSWWGPGSYEDRALRLLLRRVRATDSPVRVSVYLETWALFYGGQLQPGFLFDPRNFSAEGREAIRQRAVEWVSYLLRSYGNDPGFQRARKAGRRVPVVFFYFAGLFDPLEWQDIFARVRQATGREGFYQGDVEGADPQAQARAFDGLHVYTTAPLTAEGDLSLAARILNPSAAVQLPTSGVTDRLTVGSDYRVLATEARALGRSWSATVIPGFDDRQIRNPSFYVSRDRNGNRTYELQWRDALSSRPDWALITSFNEWHEGTEIEPSVEYGREFLARTRVWADRLRACRAGHGSAGRS